jgi:hypothetical protein
MELYLCVIDVMLKRNIFYFLIMKLTYINILKLNGNNITITFNIK